MAKHRQFRRHHHHHRQRPAGSLLRECVFFNAPSGRTTRLGQTSLPTCCVLRSRTPDLSDNSTPSCCTILSCFDTALSHPVFLPKSFSLWVAAPELHFSRRPPPDISLLLLSSFLARVRVSLLRAIWKKSVGIVFSPRILCISPRIDTFFVKQRRGEASPMYILYTTCILQGTYLLHHSRFGSASALFVLTPTKTSAFHSSHPPLFEEEAEPRKGSVTLRARPNTAEMAKDAERWEGHNTSKPRAEEIPPLVIITPATPATSFLGYR